MSDEEYQNPYDFIPLEEHATPFTQQDRIQIDALRGICGRMTITVEVLTPLCIQQRPPQPHFARVGGGPGIPASSIKGMVRGVYEVVTNSTMGLLRSDAKGWYRERVPASYRPGQDGQQLTASEALFGMVGADTDAVGRAGRLLISDLPIPPVHMTRQEVSRPQGGQPKPEHESFYFQSTPQGPILGRKFYYHQRDYQEVLRIYRSLRRMPVGDVEAVAPQTRIAGLEIRFINLLEQELAALVYTIVLEEHLAHKLGYGKPLGLGSIRLHITALEIEPSSPQGPARFLQYHPPARESWLDRVPDLRNAARQAWIERGPAGQRSYDAFQALAFWPQRENFVYPSYNFFLAEKAQRTKTFLWELQGRAPDDLYPAAPKRPKKPPPVPAGPARGIVRYRDIPPVGFVVYDQVYQHKYYLITRDSIAPPYRKLLSDQLDAGQEPLVTYEPAQEEINGNLRNVARQVEPWEGEA